MMSSLFEAWSLRDEYASWLKSLEGKRAKDLGKTECQRCGYCCACRPCIPTPDELRTIVKFLTIGVKEAVKKYFVIDALEEEGTKFLFPAKETQIDLCGRYVPWRRTYDKGFCIFFNKQTHECKIWPVRPKCAQTFECWTEDVNGEEELKQVINSWKGVDFSEFIEEVRE